MKKKKNETNVLVQEMDLQEMKDVKGGIGTWMYIDPLICVVVSEAFDGIRNT